MIVRVLRNVRAASDDVVVATSRALAPEIAALVDVPVVVDRFAARGPLGGMLSAFVTMRSSPIFVVAGDAPFVDAVFARNLAAYYEAGDEAVVPVHAVADGTLRSEPLAALYDRTAFEREATKVLDAGRGSAMRVVEALRTRYVQVDVDAATFTNVNTSEDAAAFRELLRARGEIV